jgi:AcrR family transcriptional regulator
MTGRSQGRLKPRKLPVQSRSQATIEAIFDATIQVLLAGGARALTTNRIAERAGVSVGTLYQYFPGKEALLYELVRRHLEKASEAVERACSEHAGASIETCVDVFVDAYIDAKVGQVDVSRALYLASTELDVSDLGLATIQRLRVAARKLLQESEEVTINNIDEVVFCWVAIITGGIRLIFETNEAADKIDIFRHHLKCMSRSYISSQ